MKPGGDGNVVVTPEVLAEASVWVARLHGPDRSRDMEREFLAWQASSAANRLAFERCTDTWQDAAGAAAHFRANAARRPPSDGAAQTPRGRPQPWMAALTMAMLAGVLFLKPFMDVQSYETSVGEQRIVFLDDGTRLSMNTGTRVRVAFTPARRNVELQAGEAFFEVAKSVDRPFAVRVGREEVVATGTAFGVRLTGNADVAVTLVEGGVEVRDLSAAGKSGSEPARATAMSPGERLRVGLQSGGGPRVDAPAIDRPRIEHLLAWKRGEAVFDDLSLAEAVAEMNRYSVVPIQLVPSPKMNSLRISGTFKVGDNRKFAQALAALHGLALRPGDTLELSAP